MKYFSFFIIFFVCGFLGGCVPSEIVLDKERQLSPITFYSVTGTISYYNFEKDRGDGIETESGKNNMAVLLTIHEDGGSSLGYSGSVVLGCIRGGDKKVLYRDLLQIDSDVAEVDTGSFTTGGIYNRKKVNTEPFTLPDNIDGKTIAARITRPINMYTLGRELPDGGRSGICYGYSNIEDIRVVE